MKGTVIRRGKRWSVVVDLGTDPATGKRIRKWHSGYTTRRAAEEARIEILGRVQRGEYVAPASQSLADYLVRDWLPAIKASVRESTWDSYSRNILLHVVPRIGTVRLQALSPGHLNALYADLLAEGRADGKGGLSTQSVRYIHALLHKALKDAVRWSRLSRNVAASAEPPRSSISRAGESVWSSNQLSAFLKSVREERLYAAWFLAATTGMRRGEVLGLRWTDLELDSGRLSVRQTVITVGYAVKMSTPKTRKGLRSIAIDPRTVTTLRRHRSQQLEEKFAAGASYHDNDFVFADELGAPIHPDSFGKAFKRLVAQTNLPTIRFHDLRHTHATLALKAGIHPRIISERLGHSTIAITLDTYSHVLPDMQEEAANKLAELLFEAN